MITIKVFANIKEKEKAFITCPICASYKIKLSDLLKAKSDINCICCRALIKAE